MKDLEKDNYQQFVLANDYVDEFNHVNIAGKLLPIIEVQMTDDFNADDFDIFNKG